MRKINLPAYFKRYAWACEQVDDQIWRSTFATEHEVEFDLYVMVGEQWVHFAVSPFLPRLQPAQQVQLDNRLLRFNQEMRGVHFAVDEDGDVNLLAELSRHGFSYAQFELTVNALVAYTEQLAHTLQRRAVTTTA